MSLPQPTPTERPADWEAFYRDYRKPGYVSGFEITTKLGGGMFGLVFRARKQSIGKDYAIKFLQVDDGEVRRAVLAELEQVKYFAQVDHPNLVSIEDRGEVDGIPYLVMAFAGTETLRDRIPTNGNPPAPAERDELLRYFLQCCRGLAALHERSLVHFDIKPANVFLKGAVARLGDYGLSKLITHSRGSLSMGRGTPYYMAPEMLQRRGDHRSDIYSLGVMLYELLCGRVPFTGDSEWEVLRKHETEAPALPTHLSGLERAVLQRCLQKDPAARYQSVHDLIAAFGAPSSVGAAAWTDVRAGASTGAPVPPPLPSPLPPPLPPSEDPYAGFGRASRDAARHAAKIARRAMIQARQVAQRAAKSANEVVRETMAKSRGRHFRRWRAWQRLREQRRTWKEQRDAMRAAAAAVARQNRRPHGVLRAFAFAGGTLLALAIPFLFFMPLRLASGPDPYAYSPVPLESSELVAVGTANNATYGSFVIPRGYEHLVSTSEPAWVGLAEEDRPAARAALAAHLERLRAEAPWAPKERSKVAMVPTFGPVQYRLAPYLQAELDRVLGQYLRASRFEEELAHQLEQLAPFAIAVAADQLANVSFGNRGDLERARRLQSFLEQATSCHDIALVDDDKLSAKELAKQNKHLGELWKWYVNEFAHSQRTWETFQALRGPR